MQTLYECLNKEAQTKLKEKFNCKPVRFTDRRSFPDVEFKRQYHSVTECYKSKLVTGTK